MSHFTTIKTQIRDTEALQAACTELGLELVPNAEARGYHTRTTKGEYVIRLKGPYDMSPSTGRPRWFLCYSRLIGSMRAMSKLEVGPNFGKLTQLLCGQQGDH